VKGTVDTVRKWQVLRMKSEEERPGDIVQVRFFINQFGFVEQIYLIERIGRKMVWNAGVNNDFPDITEEQLSLAFQKLAFGNLKDFRELYYILKEGRQKRLWKCIQAQKKEIQDSFKFS